MSHETETLDDPATALVPCICTGTDEDGKGDPAIEREPGGAYIECPNCGRSVAGLNLEEATTLWNAGMTALDDLGR